MDRLISMADFVIEQSKIGMEVQSISHQLSNRANRLEKIVNYAKFLKQPLTLKMFVPYDENGNFLEEPKKITSEDYNFTPSHDEVVEIYKYQEAEKSILFEGFKFNRETDKSYWLTFDCCFSHFIEKDLSQDIECIIHKGFKLTESAKKQIGL